MAAKVASTKGRQVLGDLGTNVGYVGAKKGMVEQKHENNGMISPKIGKAPARPEAEVVNPRSDVEVREYLDSIHAHFLETETSVMPPTDYMNYQPELTADMRAVCLDWIVECANRFKMSPETLFLTVNVLDRFLAVKPIQRKRMQLATMVSLVIASKYEEIYPPRIKEFIHISADAFSREDMIRYEHNILHALKYTLTVPTPFGFLSRYLLQLRPEGVPETEQDRKLKFATHFIAECSFYNLELYLQHLVCFLLYLFYLLLTK